MRRGWVLFLILLLPALAFCSLETYLATQRKYEKLITTNADFFSKVVNTDIQKFSQLEYEANMLRKERDIATNNIPLLQAQIDFARDGFVSSDQWDNKNYISFGDHAMSLNNLPMAISFYTLALADKRKGAAMNWPEGAVEPILQLAIAKSNIAYLRLDGQKQQYGMRTYYGAFEEHLKIMTNLIAWSITNNTTMDAFNSRGNLTTITNRLGGVVIKNAPIDEWPFITSIIDFVGRLKTNSTVRD